MALLSTVSRSVELKFEVVFFRREENRSTRRKTLGAGTRPNNKVNPQMTPRSGIKPGLQWWAGECSHHYAFAAPPGNSLTLEWMSVEIGFVRLEGHWGSNFLVYSTKFVLFIFPFQQKQQSFAFQGQNNQQAQSSSGQQTGHVGRFLQQQFPTNNNQNQSTPTNRQF